MARRTRERDDRVLALLKYNLLSLWVRRTTTLATTFGIALVVFVLGASQMLSTGIRQTITSAGNADQAIVLEHDARTEVGSRMDQAAAGLVAAAPGVKRNGAGQVMVTQESVAHLMLQSLVDATRISTLQVRGVSANVFELRPEARIIAGRPIQPGTDEALVGKAVLGRYPGLRIGERVEFSSSTKPTVVGVFEAAGSVYESEIWADFETVRRAFSFFANLSSITAQLDSSERAGWVCRAAGGRQANGAERGAICLKPPQPTPNCSNPQPQPPTPNPQPPTPNPQPHPNPNPNPQPPTPNPKPQTPNPKPQTPNPKPQTPNPKPQTPNPKPQTPNPKPQTPNPKPQPQPQTPNPKPQTPNPKPQTPNPNPKPQTLIQLSGFDNSNL